jgi:alpha-mannosidase
MSMPSIEPESAAAAAAADPLPPTVPLESSPAASPQAKQEGWALFALVPYDGTEPPSDLGDETAQAIWCAVSSLWHPALLARAVELPRIEPVDAPSSPASRQIRVVPSAFVDRLPPGYKGQVAEASAALVESGTDRAALIAELEARLGGNGAAPPGPNEEIAAAARDYLALGTVQWLLRDLTIAMGHVDLLDRDSLARELFAGAQAWRSGDSNGTVNRLRAAFEILTQARERFYSVDAYIIDLCLLDQALPGGALAAPLAEAVAISILAPAQAIETQAERDPERMAALRRAISDGWADVAGGTYSEMEDPLLPLESVLWQFAHGGSVYRTHLDDRNVETYARRRFGLYTQLPQLAKRFAFGYALHLGFDAGRFQVAAQTKRLWESPEGSSLESLMRPPLAADRPSQCCFLPWRMAATMKDDHVAALPLLHWPQPLAPWYLDLRRVASYSPVLGRWSTLHDFFHLTDRPYESFRPELDSYVTPYLAQAVASHSNAPVSRLVRHHRLRALLDAARAVRALARALSGSAGGSPSLPVEAGPSDERPPALGAVEEMLETGRHEDADAALCQLAPACALDLARQVAAIAPRPAAGASGRPRAGYVVLNPIGVARRAAVLLPDAAIQLGPEGPLRAAQLTDEGVYAVVELPAFGFAWVPKHPDSAQAPAATTASVSAHGRRMRNETIEVEIDASTGGIRSLTAPGESAARLGQQLAVTGLSDSLGKPAASVMRCDRFEVDYAGPALVQATSSGSLTDPCRDTRLASFSQCYRLWAGRPVLEIDITLSELEPSWLEEAAGADAWSVYMASRWAWPDPSSMLRRSVFGAPELTEAERPETPEFVDISTRTQRTALLFGGLAYHRKHGARMLDTLLVAGRESTRSFKLAVVLDLEYPFHAALDLITPAFVIPTEDGPPPAGPTGWLVHLDHKSVLVSRVEFAETIADDRPWGLIVHLLETSGQSARCRLRFFRNPTWARHADMNGDTIIELSVDGDTVSIDLTAHELARVEVALGQEWQAGT